MSSHPTIVPQTVRVYLEGFTFEVFRVRVDPALFSQFITCRYLVGRFSFLICREGESVRGHVVLMIMFPLVVFFDFFSFLGNHCHCLYLCSDSITSDSVDRLVFVCFHYLFDQLFLLMYIFNVMPQSHLNISHQLT